MQPEGNYEACCQKCKIATFMAGGNEMHCRNYHRNLLLWWEANCIGRCLFFWIHLYTPTILVATHILMEGGRKPSCLFLPVLRANSGGLTVKFNSLQGSIQWWKRIWEPIACWDPNTVSSEIITPSSGEKGYENLLLVEIQIPSVRKSSVSFVLQCSSVVYSSPNIIILS